MSIVNNMRIWKGPEKEGSCTGKMTMFVKGEHISSPTVQTYLKNNPDCKRLYLGAGREDLYVIHGLPRLATYCTQNDIEIIIECSYMGLERALKIIRQFVEHTDLTSLIVRFDDERLVYADHIKIDTHNSVTVLNRNDGYYTSLKDLNTSLHRDTFAEDIILKEIGEFK